MSSKINSQTLTEKDKIRREKVDAVIIDVIKYSLIGGIINGISLFLFPNLFSFLVSIGMGLWVLFKIVISIFKNVDELIEERLSQDEELQQD